MTVHVRSDLRSAVSSAEQSSGERWVIVDNLEKAGERVRAGPRAAVLHLPNAAAL